MDLIYGRYNGSNVIPSYPLIRAILNLPSQIDYERAMMISPTGEIQELYIGQKNFGGASFSSTYVDPNIKNIERVDSTNRAYERLKGLPDKTLFVVQVAPPYRVPESQKPNLEKLLKKAGKSVRVLNDEPLDIFSH